MGRQQRRKPIACDLTGLRIGRWMVVGPTDQRTDKEERFWTCRCQCGIERPVRTSLLTTGRSRGCGCAAKGRPKGGTNTKNAGRMCSIGGCHRPAFAKGFCQSCYNSVRYRNASPTLPISTCRWCSTTLTRRNQCFCDRSCQYKYTEKIRLQESRERIRDKRGRCSDCGVSIPLRQKRCLPCYNKAGRPKTSHTKAICPYCGGSIFKRTAKFCSRCVSRRMNDRRRKFQVHQQCIHCGTSLLNLKMARDYCSGRCKLAEFRLRRYLAAVRHPEAQDAIRTLFEYRTFQHRKRRADSTQT